MDLLHLLLLVLGMAVLLATVVDIWWTTLWIDGGAGPLTTWIMRLLGWTTRRFGGGPRSRRRSLAGPLALGGTVAWWLFLLWAGWSLVFGSASGGLVRSPEGPIGLWQIVYFAGNTLFTLGPGEILPAGAPWQVATAVAAGSGMLFITLSTTYLLRFLGAVVQERAFANQVLDVADEPVDLLVATWDGSGFGPLDTLLANLAPSLAKMSQQYQVFPLLHHYHATRAESAPSRAVVVLDEALSIVAAGVDPALRGPHVHVERVRAAIGRYLRTLREAHIDPADRSPPLPRLDRLREAGVPTRDDPEFRRAMQGLVDRRRLLSALVQRDGWEWPTAGGGAAAGPGA